MFSSVCRGSRGFKSQCGQDTWKVFWWRWELPGHLQNSAGVPPGISLQYHLLLSPDLASGCLLGFLLGPGLMCWMKWTSTDSTSYGSFPITDNSRRSALHSNNMREAYVHLESVPRPHVSVSSPATLVNANVPLSSVNATHGASLASYYTSDKCAIMAQLSQNAKFHSKGKEVGCD